MLSRFGSLDRAPKRAVTLGLASILSAKKIILMAWS
jgi:6-phosphogluconolactonase/glucosamine-6-phosphate isomerase/deaminase